MVKLHVAMNVHIIANVKGQKMGYNIDKIRNYFPILNQLVNNKPLVYLDSAASAQKPVQVLMKEEQLHNDFYGNIHCNCIY